VEGEDEQEKMIHLSRTNEKIVPFLACGDLNGFDSDRNYPVETPFLEPIQRPINAPYEVALSIKRGGGAAT